MNHAENSFKALAPETLADEWQDAARPWEPPQPHGLALPVVAPTLGRLSGLDLQDSPRIGGLSACPHEVLTARSTIPLGRSMIGREVLVVFVDGDRRAPVIVGVIQEPDPAVVGESTPAVSVQADGARQEITAEREMVLRCGEASITLTRAGHVLIRGRHIVSRSAGCNRIKGAVVDIN